MQNTNAKDIIMVWKERYDKKNAMVFFFIWVSLISWYLICTWTWYINTNSQVAEIFLVYLRRIILLQLFDYYNLLIGYP